VYLSIAALRDVEVTPRSLWIHGYELCIKSYTNITALIPGAQPQSYTGALVLSESNSCFPSAGGNTFSNLKAKGMQ